MVNINDATYLSLDVGKSKVQDGRLCLGISTGGCLQILDKRLNLAFEHMLDEC